MSNRTSIFLFFLGSVILASVHFFLSFGTWSNAPIVQRTTLANSNTRWTSLVLTRKGKPPAHFEKANEWQLVEPYVSDIDHCRVKKLIDELSFTHIEESISDNELLRLGRSRKDLGLNPSRLTVELAAGTKSQRIFFGALTPATNGVYAAIEGEQSVFVVPRHVLEAIDIPLDAFRSRTIFSIGPESVSSFDIKRGNSAILSFTRENDQWKVGSSLAATAKVNHLLKSVMTSSAQGFVWPVGATNEQRTVSTSLLAVYELDPDSTTTISLKCIDGINRRISFGCEADDGHIYALVQNGNAIVTVDSKLYDLVKQDEVMFTDSRLFPYDETSVRSFTLSENGIDYFIARNDEGVWRLDAPVVAPADSANVAAILNKVLALSALDIRSNGIKVSLSTNSEPVSVSRLSILGKNRLEDIRSKDILRIDPVVVKRIVRAPIGGTNTVKVVYQREKRVWNIEGDSSGSINEKGILAILNSLNPLKAKQIEKLKVSADELSRYGLDTPYLTIAIDQDRDESVRRNILIGRETEGGRFATIGTSDAIFLLSDDVVEQLASPLVVK